MAIYLRQLLLLAAVLTAPFPARATTGQYIISILGRVQHQYNESAFNAACVNDNGVVAGSAIVRVPDNFGLTLRGVVWENATPHYTILGSISEASQIDSLATSINNSGTAVGQSAENTSGGMVYVPVIFTSNGIVDLGIKNASSGIAIGINNNNQVVGNLTWVKPGQGYNGSSVQAFLYQNGVMTLLGYPAPNWGYDAATAINNNGLIVGSVGFAAETPAHAAYYTNGAWVDLGTIGNPLTYTGAATSVNDSGTIVGTWSNPDYFGEGPRSGYFIYQNGQINMLLTPVPYPPGPYNPFINNAGQIVVANWTAIPNGGWQDLNDIDLGDGWTFTQALGINNAGAIIGLVYRQVNGTTLYRSALLTPVTSNQQPASRTP
jgi:probable HAF family extracellular repeat protein